MNTRPLYPLFILLILLVAACNKQPLDVPQAAEITKAEREELGAHLLQIIRQNPGTYPLLPDTGAYSTVYDFVQTLYNQVTVQMRLDLDAPPENRWNRDRPWQVFILDRDAAADAFVLPGGDFFITTGFLKSMEQEYELYYLLAFEADLMHENFLFDKMISAYNTLNYQALARGAAQSNGITAVEVLKDTEDLAFDENEVRQLDALTVPVICETSVYRADGVNGILQNDTEIVNFWLQKRMNYAGRAMTVTGLAEENGACGLLRTNGAYEERVLGILE